MNMHALAMGMALLLGSNVQLDAELKQNFSGGETSVEVVSKVSKTGDTYTYMYSIKNTGKQSVKVKWDTLSKAMQYGSDIDLLLELKPGENLNFVLEHPDEPVQLWGRATAYYPTSKESFEDMIKRLPEPPKGVKMQIMKKDFHVGEMIGVMSVLPKSYTPQQFRPYGAVK